MRHPGPEELALAALPGETVDPQAGEHLRECAACRDEVVAHRRTVELARAGGRDGVVGPSPRVWRGIVAELAGEVLQADTAAPIPGRRASGRWRAAAALLVAASIGLGVGAGLATRPADPGEGGVLVALRSVDPAARAATGSVEIAPAGAAREMRLQVDGVPAAERDDYLEAWLIDDTGTRLLSLGPLVPDGAGFTGRFRVPADAPVAEFAAVDVSAERWDGDPGHSRRSIVRGELP